MLAYYNNNSTKGLLITLTKVIATVNYLSSFYFTR